jgi:hypothetical protein
VVSFNFSKNNHQILLAYILQVPFGILSSIGYKKFSSILIKNLGFLHKILGGVLKGKFSSTLGISSIFKSNGIDGIPSIEDGIKDLP